MGYERSNIARLDPYTPGEQPQVAQVIKLNTNENPYPPADAVLRAVREVDGERLRRYPSPNARAFREAAAQVHGLSPDQVIATNGGDELLRMVVGVFCEPGAAATGAEPRAVPGAARPGGVGVAEPSYSLYPVLAAIHDTSITRVPLLDGFALPPDFARRLNDAGCKLAIVVNPHAPSGRLEAAATLEAVARAFQGVLVIDEAYVDFATHDCLSLVRAGGDGRGLENVLLLRTLSKGYSLAGLRFGYGLGHPKLVAALDKARDSYNTDVLSQAAAVAALRSRDVAAGTWRKVTAERERLAGALRAKGWCVAPSQSNFLLATPPMAPGERDREEKTGDHLARRLYESLKAGNIFVRYFDQARLRQSLRITVGTPEQNDALLANL